MEGTRGELETVQQMVWLLSLLLSGGRSRLEVTTWALDDDKFGN